MQTVENLSGAEYPILADDQIASVVDAIDFSQMVTADDFVYVIARAIEEAVRGIYLPNERREDRKSLEKALHYPKCWDVAAYPTVESAALEAVHGFECSECSEPAKNNDEWVLVKRERLEEIKNHARVDTLASYRGNGLYDESALVYNEQVSRVALDRILEELQMIEEDEKENSGK